MRQFVKSILIINLVEIVFLVCTLCFPLGFLQEKGNIKRKTETNKQSKKKERRRRKERKKSKDIKKQKKR